MKKSVLISMIFINVIFIYLCPWRLYASPQEQENNVSSPQPLPNIAVQSDQPQILDLVPVNKIEDVEITGDVWNTIDLKIYYRYEKPDICGGSGKAVIKINALNGDPSLFSSSDAIIDIQPPKLHPNPSLHYPAPPSPLSYQSLRLKWRSSLPFVTLSLTYKGIRPLQSQLEITMNCESSTTGIAPLSSISINKTWADISNAGDLDSDGLRDEAEDFFANKFAPIVRLSVNEHWLPSSVDWYLERVRMKFSHTGVCYGDCLVVDDVTMTNIFNQTHKGKAWVSLCNHKGTTYYSKDSSKDTFYLEQRWNSVENGDSNSANWPVYTHVFPNSQNPYDNFSIQYWFFYPYNRAFNPLGVEMINHESDWENIALIIDYKGDLVRAFYSQHNGGACYQKDTIQSNGTHPVVYSAKGTHANYDRTGTFAIPDVPESIMTDKTDDLGIRWNTWNKVINIGEKGRPLNGQQFILYGGLWGNIGKLSVIDIDITTSIQGPAFQHDFDTRSCEFPQQQAPVEKNCLNDSECDATTQKCYSTKVCKPKDFCTLDSDCRGGATVCRNHKCVRQCIRNTDCPPGGDWGCYNGACVAK